MLRALGFPCQVLTSLPLSEAVAPCPGRMVPALGWQPRTVDTLRSGDRPHGGGPSRLRWPRCAQRLPLRQSRSDGLRPISGATGRLRIAWGTTVRWRRVVVGPAFRLVAQVYAPCRKLCSCAGRQFSRPVGTNRGGWRWVHMCGYPNVTRL